MSTIEKISVVPDAAGLFWESRISEALGVPRKVLAKYRTTFLKEGEHFVRRENNAVALTAAGLSAVEAWLDDHNGGQDHATAQETGGKPAPKDIPAGPPPRQKLTVERVPQNPALLLCVSEETRALVIIRVRENINFTPGMRLEAIESSDGVWQFRNRLPGDESTVGRLPRGKGKW